MPTSRVTFYVKKLEGSNCNTVDTEQEITLYLAGNGQQAYPPFWTDATGYVRKTIERAQYYAYTNGGCQTYVNVNRSRMTVTLCNTCAVMQSDKGGWEGRYADPVVAATFVVECPGEGGCVPVKWPVELTITPVDSGVGATYETDEEGHAVVLLAPGAYKVLTNGGCEQEVAVTPENRIIEICNPCAALA